MEARIPLGVGKQDLFNGLGQGYIVTALPIKSEVATAGPRLKQALSHLRMPCKAQGSNLQGFRVLEFLRF
jgi:hypothetical protein